MRTKIKFNPEYVLAGSIATLAFVVFLPALYNDFVEWDDNFYIFDNPHIRSIDTALLKWAFSSLYAQNWHPLTWISHAVDYAAWGLNPFGHHLTNNLLHAANTFLVVLLAMKLIEIGTCGARHVSVEEPGCPPILGGTAESRSGKPLFIFIAAGVTGALFGLHPLRVESVAWVSERKDLLCALFYLLSIMMYTKYAQRAGDIGHKVQVRMQSTKVKYQAAVSCARYEPGPLLYALCFFALALLSKPMAVSLPLVLLILDWHPFGRIVSFRTFVKAMPEKMPFVALSAVSAVLTIAAQKAGGAMEFMESVPLPTRLTVAAGSLLRYLLKIVMPSDLVPFYPYPKEASLFAPTYFAGALLIAGITAAALCAARKKGFLTAVWLYYFVTLIPVLGIVQVGSQALADRYSYLPSIGPFLISGLGASWLSERLKDRGTFPKLSLLVIGCSILFSICLITVKQISVWNNSITLWTYVIEKETERIPQAYNNRGLGYSRAGQYEKAVQDYKRALALKPGYADAYSNLGIALAKKGSTEQAIENYLTAIRINPQLANAHRNLAAALYLEGRFREALEHYIIVARLRPEDPGAQTDLGAAYGATGDYYTAIRHFQTALQLSPDSADAHYNIATAYSAVGLTDRAAAHYEAARRLTSR